MLDVKLIKSLSKQRLYEQFDLDEVEKLETIDILLQTNEEWGNLMRSKIIDFDKNLNKRKKIP